MLFLTILFSMVFVIFIYALRPDKGKHTKYARGLSSVETRAAGSSRQSNEVRSAVNMHSPM